MEFTYRQLLASAFSLVLCTLSLQAASSEGTLTVRTDPDGVEVWLNDTYIGDSPVLDKKLKVGKYSLKLVDPLQHSSTVEEIFVSPGEATVVEKTIQSKFGSLKITTEPAGAEVLIVTPIGKTPINNEFIVPGKYRLEIKPPLGGYADIVEDVNIERGKPVTLTKTLVRKNPFTPPVIVRIGLGAVALAGFTWAMIEQGNYTLLMEQHKNGAADWAGARRTAGMIIGCVGVAGFEVVAFF